MFPFKKDKEYAINGVDHVCVRNTPYELAAN
jgi:hypothetical protein